MKKIFSLILALTLVLSALPTISIAETAQVDLSMEKSYASMLNTIGALEQVINDEDYTRYVTKSELVGAVVDLMGDSASPVAKTLYSLADITSETPNAAKIEFAKGMGLIEDTSLFHPNLNAESDDAISMFITILGYEQYSAVYSDNWIAAARIGLLDGVSLTKSSAFTWADFIVLLYNATQVDILQTASFNQDGASYEAKDGQTLLTEYFEVYEFEGIVYANESTSLVAETGVSEGYVQVDNLLMKVGTSGIENLIGYSVEGYAKLDNNKYTVLYAAPFDNKIWEIDDSELITESSQWSPYCIVYEDGNNDRTLKLPADVDVIYNGKNLFDYTADDLKVNTGKLIAIDNNTDGKVDVLIIEAIENYIVKAYDSTEYVLYDKTGKKLSLDDDKVEVNIVNAIDEPYDLAMLTENTIVSLLISKDKSCVKGYVTKAKVSGVVKEIEKNGERIETLILDSTEYKVSNSWYSAKLANKPEITLGKRYVGYLDVNGEIAMFVEKASESVMYGFLYGFGSDSSKGLNAKPAFRVFNDEGIWVDYSSAKKININGTSYNSDELMKYTDTVNTLKAQQLIKFELNADNEIKAVHTAVSTNEVLPGNELSFNGSQSKRWDSSGSVFDMLYSMDAGTKIFYTPQISDVYDKENFDILTASNFNDERTYGFDMYDLDEFKRIGAMVVREKASRDYWNNGAIFVKKLTKILDEDGDEVYAVKGINKGVEVTYRAVSDEYVSGLVPGDIIIAHFDTNKMIDQPVKYIYTHNQEFAVGEYGLTFTDKPVSSYTGEAFIMCGYAQNKNASTLILNTSVNERCIPLSLIRYITVYDADAAREEDKFTSATVNDIMYSDDFTEASRILIYFRSSIPLDLVIIK